MTLNEFGRFINTKSVGRIEPVINEQLTERVYSGMKQIARDATPLKWVESSNIDAKILRRIDSESWIRFPKKPILDSGEQIDIEEALIEALSFYVIAGLEVQRAKVNMGMYWNEIDRYNSNLIETYMEVATNDAQRFHVFP